ncbi:hypothetical protein [Streptomyces sp. NPDC097610]|uniref:hypothetical protein n=1 Tax=Streptomyces sp. NPDC097610 TaxID=3157227 RepID=UPI003318EC25
MSEVGAIGHAQALVAGLDGLGQGAELDATGLKLALVAQLLFGLPLQAHASNSK